MSDGSISRRDLLRGGRDLGGLLALSGLIPGETALAGPPFETIEPGLRAGAAIVMKTRIANNSGCAKKKAFPCENFSGKPTAWAEWMRNWTKCIWLTAKTQVAVHRMIARLSRCPELM